MWRDSPFNFTKKTSATTNEGEKGKIESREELQMQLSNTLLQVYSNNPQNYALLKFPIHGTQPLPRLPFLIFLSPDLKLIVIKTLEYVCSGVANCAPVDASVQQPTLSGLRVRIF